MENNVDEIRTAFAANGASAVLTHILIVDAPAKRNQGAVYDDSQKQAREAYDDLVLPSVPPSGDCGAITRALQKVEGCCSTDRTDPNTYRYPRNESGSIAASASPARTPQYGLGPSQNASADTSFQGGVERLSERVRPRGEVDVRPYDVVRN